jgi:hypothetical protein
LPQYGQAGGSVAVSCPACKAGRTADNRHPAIGRQTVAVQATTSALPALVQAIHVLGDQRQPARVLRRKAASAWWAALGARPTPGPVLVPAPHARGMGAKPGSEAMSSARNCAQ